MCRCLSYYCVYFFICLFLTFCFFFFFFNDTATTEIYTLSLHDALPISPSSARPTLPGLPGCRYLCPSTRRCNAAGRQDRKSTRLNSSHLGISYAVFCLKKKKKQQNNIIK